MIKTLQGEPLVYMEESDDGNLEAGWCVETKDRLAKNGVSYSLCKYYGGSRGGSD